MTVRDTVDGSGPAQRGRPARLRGRRQQGRRRRVAVQRHVARRHAQQRRRDRARLPHLVRVAARGERPEARGAGSRRHRAAQGPAQGPGPQEHRSAEAAKGERGPGGGAAGSRAEARARRRLLSKELPNEDQATPSAYAGFAAIIAAATGCRPCRSVLWPRSRSTGIRRCCRPAPSSTKMRSRCRASSSGPRGVEGINSYMVKLGDMAFNSPAILGGLARQAGISCNTCHVSGSSNPDFSSRACRSIREPSTRPARCSIPRPITASSIRCGFRACAVRAISRLTEMTGGSPRCATSSTTSSSTSSPVPSRRLPFSTRWWPTSRTSTFCPIRVSGPAGDW